MFAKKKFSHTKITYTTTLKLREKLNLQQRIPMTSRIMPKISQI